jgi:hypothetical protein
LEDKNQKLKEEMEKLYDKDKIYTNNVSRQNEEQDNFIKILQSDIQSITDERLLYCFNLKFKLNLNN